MIRQLYKETKYLPLMLLVLNFLIGLGVPLTIYLSQNLLDAVLGNLMLKKIYFYLLMLFIAGFSITILNKVGKLITVYLSGKIEIIFGEKIFKKCFNVSYNYFEDTRTYQVIDRVMTNYRDNFMDFIDIVSSAVRIIASLFGVFYYIININRFVFILLLITALPVWLFSVISTLKERDSFIKYYPALLKSRYLSEILTRRVHAKETRLFNPHHYIEGLWEKNLSHFQKGQILSNLKPRFLTGFFLMLQYIVVTSILFVMIIFQSSVSITMGIYIALAQAMWNLVGNLQYEIIFIIFKANKFRVFRNDYLALFGFHESQTAYQVVVPYNFNKIVFDDVWYRYSDSGEYILKGIDLTITKDKVVALVGKNGSGKTTIIKLLLGLLLPSRGAIYIDGIPAVNIPAAERRKIMSVVFQDHVKYSLSLRENIGISDINNINDERQMNDILRMLNKSKLADKLPHGFDTVLGKEIDNGIDISGGEWQTIAIARALFSKSRCVIMDEPASSLDPLAEVEVYKQLMQSVKDRTAVLVTHRLGSVTEADCIYAIDNGVVVEKGAHRELMEKGGLYAEMFNQQKKWYN
jgi:ABC-type multidrug transport system fused ATPase/permease subunit